MNKAMNKYRLIPRTDGTYALEKYANGADYWFLIQNVKNEADGRSIIANLARPIIEINE